MTISRHFNQLTDKVSHQVGLKLQPVSFYDWQLSRMAQTSNPLVLSGVLGSEKIMGAKRDIPARNEMTLAKVDGSTSFYIVYRDPDYQETNWSAENSKVVDSSAEIELGFPARSTQGWDKVGISVFEHIYYCGTGATYKSSYPDITNIFPPGDQGASSFSHEGSVGPLQWKELQRNSNFS